jgi:hypothetical protein
VVVFADARSMHPVAAEAGAGAARPVVIVILDVFPVVSAPGLLALSSNIAAARLACLYV